ncbi:MAG: 6-phosphogluconolactonase [Lysobacterales bacterium CG17_big_fil_post_rev_8_21_14_2_50_64_11]|nr:MAG: 6-phosphogluconolactonase [Xanthomonadales bacterium CG17_big_fil_post_rev_8_21_14_2_50_64_11]PIX61332.1 MAG: 6-phosphogluconolactonase [Xanthomonadales bacterium CG_4_10_14_3_um_filter_64_11]
MSTVQTLHAPAPLWHVHADAAAWAEAAAAQITQQLHRDLHTQPQALLLLSGGSTPEPVYRALAAQSLDWSRLVVALVDERFVPPDSPGSNGRLLRAVFAHGPAAAATLWPLVDADLPLDACVARGNARIAELGLAPSAVVFGMGEDGHTASLFPGAAGLDAALHASARYVAIDASGCPVAGDYPQRITLTPAGWRAAHARFLLIRGERKRAVLQHALVLGEVSLSPVVAAAADGAVPLHIHWNP